MDFYRFLLDIQSLDHVIKRHLDESEEERKRIEFLSKQKLKREEEYSDKKTQKAELKDQITSLEKELFTIDEKIKKSQEHLSMASSQNEVDALNKEIENLSPRQEEIEESVLEKLDQVETIEEGIKVDEEYFSGISDTIAEIQEEVDAIEAKNKGEIEKLEKQIEALLIEIPNDFKPMYDKVREKYRFNSPITKLTGTACAKCRMQISSAEAGEINNSFQHRICSGCGRIIISNQVS